MKEAVERELNKLIPLGENRQTLMEIIADRVIVGFRIGRKCIGTTMEWVEGSHVEVPKYKETRFVLVFSDGLSLNVDKSVFHWYRKKGKIEYFGFYE